ncbi:MAG TPA: 2-C-methyl-D-erythritol 4-phosphate cytidylyltransferase [Thermoanaerobaculia bacterium]|jgi:2-C-methyl-D-erythritol 4-phosphate cytidylyltransferase|nr:2-C-methyl-D-erythritol 4-phosphate cytidylyltransferase [Thermoanaerobaculia bacterium]
MAVVALIPAAGFGSRFHESGPKALVSLFGRPLLVHALERLHASGRVERAVIAIASGHDEAFKKALASSPMPTTLVDGGVTRRASVANALRAAEVSDDDFICIHDAARPLIDPAEVSAVVDAASASGAAVAGFSMVETVKRVSEGAVTETVPRYDLVAATTPQVFRASLFRAAFEKEGSRDVTDDAELVERSGVKVSVVLTSRWNIKITYPEDLLWAEAFLANTQAGG